MPSNLTQSKPGYSQAVNRIRKIFYDQHKAKGYEQGRAWWAWCEKQVDGSDAAPIAELSPVSADMELEDGTRVKGWTAPWIPEQKYLMLAIRGMNGQKFRIDYAAMRRDYEAANQNYYARANAAAFQASWEPIELYAPVPFQLQSARVNGEPIGAPPKSPKIPEAAMAGDHWLLGFSHEVNERLQELLAADNRMATSANYYRDRMWRGEPAKSAALDGFTEDEIADAARVLKQAKTMRDAKAKKAQTAAEEAA